MPCRDLISVARSSDLCTRPVHNGICPPGCPRSRSSAVSGPTPPVRVVGTVATGLQAPWGLAFPAFLPDGTAVVSERDTARIVLVAQDSVTQVGLLDDVVPGGEGGLLGIAYADGWLYAYFTAAADNRVVRIPWTGGALGAAQPILTGIPKSASLHNNTTNFLLNMPLVFPPKKPQEHLSPTLSPLGGPDIDLPVSNNAAVYQRLVSGAGLPHNE
ncbi:MAG: hypothetical protein EBU54_12555 [Mycobacteriaceae bacterium]|nr:hypothetical protein [Mycobacteriaceae bacterium]